MMLELNTALLTGQVEVAVAALTQAEAIALMAATDREAGQEIGAVLADMAALASARAKIADGLDRA